MYRITDPRLNEKPLSHLAEPIWNTFWTLHSTRQIGQTGFQPLTYLEIEAFMRLMDIDLEPYEVQIIKRMDIVFLNTLNTTKESTK
jgi:hypothetical protein